MIEIIEKNDCCGCSACYNSCSLGAISMEMDEEGFIYPLVDNEKCVKCGKCLKHCPLKMDSALLNREIDIECYVAQLKEKKDLKYVSSGGAFWAFSRAILDKNGAVYGACQLDVKTVAHIRAVSIEEAKLLRRSKYLQSDIGQIYKLVKQDLNNDIIVLFSGTPCQIAGLRAFLNREYENLFLCEVICHGVPSRAVWESFLREYENQKSISVDKVIYRDKSNGWKSNQYRFEYVNGESECERSTEQIFHAGYLQGLYYRPSCGNCKFASLPRLSDISLADFWQYNGEFNGDTQQDGLSLIVVNNKKGILLLNNSRKYLEFERTSVEEALNSCHHLLHSPVHSLDRAVFFKILLRDGFYSAAHKYVVTNSVKDLYKRIKRKVKRLIYEKRNNH
jgi:coenzyme F420-reducing hydrogenase beta subunit